MTVITAGAPDGTVSDVMEQRNVCAGITVMLTVASAQHPLLVPRTRYEMDDGGRDVGVAERSSSSHVDGVHWYVSAPLATMRTDPPSQMVVSAETVTEIDGEIVTCTLVLSMQAPDVPTTT